MGGALGLLPLFCVEERQRGREARYAFCPQEILLVPSGCLGGADEWHFLCSIFYFLASLYINSRTAMQQRAAEGRPERPRSGIARSAVGRTRDAKG